MQTQEHKRQGGKRCGPGLYGLLLSPWLATAALAQVVVPASQLNSTRTVRFERDALTGVVNAELTEPASAQHCLHKVYQRDSYGNITQATVQNCVGVPASGSAVFASRVTATAYQATGASAAGLYPSSQTNPTGHTQQLQHHNAFGLPSRVQDANGLVTQYTYDSLGRRLKAQHPDGNQTHWRYDYCAAQAASSGSVAFPVDPGPCPAGAAYRVGEVPLSASGSVNGPSHATYFDAQGREIQTQTLAFADAGASPKWALVRTEYDPLGRVSGKSEPHFAGDSVTWTTYRHDVLGRVVQESKPNPYASGRVATRTYAYRAKTIVATNPRGHTQTRELDEFGRTILLTDAKGAQQSYQFSAWGPLHQTRDALGNVTQIYHDQSGHKARMIDPGMGAWAYRHDPLGQLRSQTSPKNQTATFAYDTLGRLIQRSEPDLTSTFHYDQSTTQTSCASGASSKGLLCEAKSDNGYRRVNQYDRFGRITRSATQVAASGPAYVSKIAYNSDGRISRQTWPTGLAVDSLYDGNTGALVEMQLAPSGQPLWKRLSNNARGQFTQVWYGNGAITANSYNADTGLLTGVRVGPSSAPTLIINQGYSYNALGHLTKRTDARHATQEIFGYDELNRLSSALLNNTSSAQLLRSLTWQYDPLGNILYNSEVGVYSYASGPGTRPHAVQSIQGQAGKLTNPSYSYDAHGNIASVTGSNGVQRSHSWTSFDMPQSLRLNQDSVEVSFLYGPEHQRIREVSSKTVGAVTTHKTLNILHPDNEGGLYFEREDKTTGGVSSSENRHYITAENGAFLLITSASAVQAEPVATEQAAAQQRYWHKDHLGSLMAATDGSLKLIERLAYDPFGKRRNINGTADQAGVLEAKSTNRGYTGHEHLDELDVIHMNARVYDPDTGRFLSADPTVPDAANPQAFNRYAYALNNPLNMTDPTGYFSWNVGGPNDKGGSTGYGYTRADGSKTEYGGTNNKLSGGRADGPETPNKTGNASMPGVSGNLAVQINAGTGFGSFVGQGLQATQDMLDGGYGLKAKAAWNSGNILGAVGNVAAGTAYGVMNVMTLGVGGTVSKVSASLTARALAEAGAARGAASAKQAADLSKHLGYVEKYGKGGVKELESGRIRYYGEVQSARNPGEMAGARYVHEYDAATGRSRGWLETVDQAGNVRQVRPELNNGSKTHYQFDRSGNYTGSW